MHPLRALAHRHACGRLVDIAGVKEDVLELHHVGLDEHGGLVGLVERLDVGRGGQFDGAQFVAAHARHVALLNERLAKLLTVLIPGQAGLADQRPVLGVGQRAPQVQAVPFLISKLPDAGVHVGVAHRHAFAFRRLIEQSFPDQEIQDRRALFRRHGLTGAQLKQLDLGAQFAYADHIGLVQPYRGSRAVDRLRDDRGGKQAGDDESKTGCAGDHCSSGTQYTTRHGRRTNNTFPHGGDARDNGTNRPPVRDLGQITAQSRSAPQNHRPRRRSWPSRPAQEPGGTRQVPRSRPVRESRSFP